MGNQRFSDEIHALIKEYCVDKSLTYSQVVRRMIRELEDQHIKDALFKAFCSSEPTISDILYYLEDFGDRY